jgi:DNA-binding MarR family transcriptional regulator
MAEIEDLFAQIRLLTDWEKRATGLVTNGFPQMGRTILQLVRAHGSLSVPQIARLAGTSRQNIQLWVNRFKLEGHLALASNPAHKRSALVRLTEQGSAMRTVFATQEVKLLDRLSSNVSQSEVNSAVVLLRRVGQLLAEEESPQHQAAERRTTRGRPKKAEKPARQRRVISGMAGRKQTGSPVVTPEESKPVEEEFPLNLL